MNFTVVTQEIPLFSDILWSLPQNVNKYNRGSVLVVGGSTGMAGAPVLAAEAAFKIGAGLVTIAHPDKLIDIYKKMLPETMTLPLASTPAGTIARSAAEQILLKMDSYDVLVIGPGLSKNPETIGAITEIIVKCKKPKVVDATAIFAISEVPATYDKFTVLTPHAGEMTKLIRTSSIKNANQIEDDKLTAAKEFISAEPDPILVLKGHDTVVANGETGRVVINKTGSQGLAKAGTGDVLAGLIGGLAAQNVDRLFEAAVTAVYLHGLSGDLAEEEIGQRSITASDVVKHLPKAVKEAEKKLE